jgi:DNA repair exonuclease SbcCD ATPase subunit
VERFSDWLKANSYVDVNIDKWMPLDEALKQLKTSEEALENTINNLNSDTSIKEDDCFWVDDYGGKWVSRLVVASLQGWEDAVNQAELGEKFTESLVIKKLTEKIAALTEENAYLEKKESSIKDNSAELESFKSKYNKDIASRDSKIESLQESLDEVKSNAENWRKSMLLSKKRQRKTNSRLLASRVANMLTRLPRLKQIWLKPVRRKRRRKPTWVF